MPEEFSPVICIHAFSKHNILMSYMFPQEVTSPEHHKTQVLFIPFWNPLYKVEPVSYELYFHH